MKTYKVFMYVKAKDETEAEEKFCGLDREVINDSVMFEEE